MRKIGTVVIALFLAVLVFGLSHFPAFDIFERRTLDLFFKIRGPETPHPSISIIDIDDQSLLQFGAWPWPRSMYRDLLEILGVHEPKVIFFDMVFSEASQTSEDTAFAEAIRQAGNVVLPLHFLGDHPRYFSGESAVLPIQEISQGAKRLGFVNVLPDRDGHVREFTPFVSRFEHASVAIVAAYDPARFEKLNPKLLTCPKCFINFPGPYESFQQISFRELVEGGPHSKTKSFLDSIRGGIVLIGHTAAGTAMDLKPTAFSPQYPGVGLQASMVHTLLTQKLIQRLPSVFHLGLLILFSLLVPALSLNQNPLRSLLYVGASLAILFECAQIAFQYFNFWFPYFSFFLLGSVLYLLFTLIELIRERVEREIFARELVLASRIQKNLLPAEIPTIPGFQIAAFSLPARHVGGDFYDILPLPHGTWGVCVGDVSGKGIPAALFMARAISEFRREADQDSPSTVLKRLNAKITNEKSQGLFLTLLYLIVDPSSKKIVFSNAGHEPLLLYRKESRSVELLSSWEGMPLGIDLDQSFDEREEVVKPGDVLFLISDGVKEAMNTRREIFGTDRTKSALSDFASLEADSLIQSVLKRIQDYVKDAAQHDDLTMVCLKFL